MFACPLFYAFQEVTKIAKFEGAEWDINTVCY